jgi:tetratricopeptide (TPR) repeat protein
VYLTGRQELNRFTTASIARAVDLLTRATQLDATFAKAHAWLAMALLQQDAVVGSAPMWSALRKATQLAPDDAEVLTASGFAREIKWDWKGAQADFARAISLDPANTWAMWGLTEIETALDNGDVAVELGRRAATIDPLVAGDLYPVALRRAGRVDESLAAARAGLALDSLSTSNGWWLEIAYVLASRGDVAGYRDADKRQVALGRSSTYLEASALARAGRTEEARAVLQLMRLMTRQGKIPAVNMAGAFASLGEADSAFAWLNRITGRTALHIPTSLFLGPIRSDPRYMALLKRIGLR